MASPLGHGLMGLLVYRQFSFGGLREKWNFLLVCLFCAMAPDLDILPGLLVGQPNLFHHGVTHSLGFALLFALALSLIYGRGRALLRLFGVFVALYCSHLFLDYITIDTSLPYGAPFLWPLSDAYYLAPFAFLPDIHRSSESNLVFLVSLVNLHNLFAAFVEILIFAPLMFASRITRFSRRLLAGGSRVSETADPGTVLD
jgi:inner membrane protein